MNTGTKSLLFGVHNFFIHTLFTTIAWRRLYGRWPSVREFVCIIIHDIGYWQSPNMDDERGQRHPEYGAALAKRWFGQSYADLILGHSRYYIKKFGVPTSLLLAADKLGNAIMPWWLYIPLARLSGEIKEYRQLSLKLNGLPLSASDREWHRNLTRMMKNKAQQANDPIKLFEEEIFNRL